MCTILITTYDYYLFRLLSLFTEGRLKCIGGSTASIILITHYFERYILLLAYCDNDPKLNFKISEKILNNLNRV